MKDLESKNLVNCSRKKEKREKLKKKRIKSISSNIGNKRSRKRKHRKGGGENCQVDQDNLRGLKGMSF